MSKEKTSFRHWVSEKIVNTTSIPDRIASQRAVVLVKKCGIKNYLKDDGKYLDIGSGLGHIVEEVIREEDEKNITYLAVDPVWKPLSRLHERTKDNFPDRNLFMKADGEHLPVKDNSMDGVSLFFVMHHVTLENQQIILNEINRILKADGVLFVTEDVPEDQEEAERNAIWDRRLNFEPKDEPHYYKNNQEWKTYFEQNGFEVIENIYFEDISKKKKEGVIRHRSYILRKKNSVNKIAEVERKKLIRTIQQ